MTLLKKKKKPNKKRLKENKIILTQIALSFLALGLSLFLLFWPKAEKAEIEAAEIASSTPSKAVFENLELEAKAFVVYDPSKSEVVYGKEEKESLPLASLTKLMTAAVASDFLTPTSTVIIGEESLAEDGDSGLIAGERWNFPRLLNFVLVSSSNDGAAAIASAAGLRGEKNFVDSMNEKAGKLGLNETKYSSPTGLDFNDAVPSAYGSAEDVAKLLAYLLKTRPETLEATRYLSWEEISLDHQVHQVKNTNDIAGSLTGLLASKTGYTQSSGGNLAIAVDVGLNQPIVLVVLGSSREGRFSDMGKLYQTTLAFFRQNS